RRSLAWFSRCTRGCHRASCGRDAAGFAVNVLSSTWPTLRFWTKGVSGSPPPRYVAARATWIPGKAASWFPVRDGLPAKAEWTNALSVWTRASDRPETGIERGRLGSTVSAAAACAATGVLLG